MELYNQQLTKYDIPISHLDHKYIRECNDASEIEKIIKILRSKQEGHFPDIEKVAEERLEILNPKSKLLWKPGQLLTTSDFTEEERNNLMSDVQQWKDIIKVHDNDLKDFDFDRVLPPVRGASVVICSENIRESKPSRNNKRVKPRDYSEWDKLDVEEELKKVDEKRKLMEEQKKKNIEEDLSGAGIPDQLKPTIAEREKNKGNEAFKAGDFDEALVYYNRSISVLKTAPAYNNRAQIYLNRKDWVEALDDCDNVVRLNPSNVKAHMRRAVALKELGRHLLAQDDLKFVLEKEPNNKQALVLLEEVEKVLEEQKTSGRRMKIEEVEESEEEDDGVGCPEGGVDRPEGGVDRPEDDVGRNDASDNADGLGGCKNPSAKVGNGFDKKDDRLDSGNEDNTEEDDSEVNDGTIADNTNDGDDIDLKNVSKVDATAAEPDLKNADDETSLAGDNLNFDKACYCEEVTKQPCDKCDNIKQLLRVIASDGDHYHYLVESYVAAKEKEFYAEHRGDGSALPSDAEKVERKSWLSVFISSATPELISAIPVVKSACESIRLGQYAEGLASIEGCLETLKDPSTSEGRMIYEFVCLSKAKCNMMLGELRTCIRVCDDVLRINSLSTGALFRKAMAYDQLENYEQAYVHFKSIPSSDTKHPVAEKLSENCARALRQMNGEDWKSKLPPPPPACQSPSASSSSSSPPPEAVHESPSAPPSLTTSDSPAPSSSLPATNESTEELYEEQRSTGNNLFSKGDFNGAIECFTKCIELKKDQVVPYTNRALCYLRLEQFDEVLEDCNHALIIDFQCTKALYRRALAYKMKGNYEMSIVDLETLLNIDPGNSAAKKELSNVSNIAKQAKEKKAVEALLRDQKKMRQKILITEVSSSDVPTKPCQKCSKENQDRLTQQKSCKKSSQVPTAVTFSKTTRSVRPPLTTASGRAGKPVTSPYEFMQAFNAAKVAGEFSAFFEIFENLKPSQLPRVVTNQLDSYMAVIIIRIINHYFSFGMQNKAVDYLTNLVSCERFDMVSMFFNEEERDEVSDMLEKASEYMDSSELHMIKLKFRM